MEGEEEGRREGPRAPCAKMKAFRWVLSLVGPGCAKGAHTEQVKKLLGVSSFNRGVVGGPHLVDAQHRRASSMAVSKSIVVQYIQ